MDYYVSIQKSLDYIEQNLKMDIDINLIVNQSFFSITHFYRIFQAMVGDSVKDYIRKRRLSNAAIELLTSEKRLIDIAFEYGFQSQEVFTRAFLRTFDTTPGRYRVSKSKIVLYEKVNIHQRNITILNGGIIMEPKIIFDKEFKVIGMKRLVKPGDDTIKSLWCDFNARRSEIKNATSPDVCLGLCEYIPNLTNDSNFTYIACIEAINFSDVPNGMISKTIPHSKYAIFTHKGPLCKLKSTYAFIYASWLPNSTYELAELDTIELYDSRSADCSSPDYEFDIYIPIK